MTAMCVTTNNSAPQNYFELNCRDQLDCTPTHRHVSGPFDHLKETIFYALFSGACLNIWYDELRVL